MFKSDKVKLIILAFGLFIALFCVIIFGDKSYTYVVKIKQDINNIDSLSINIIQDDDILEITEKNYDNGVLTLKLNSLKKGKAYIEIGNENGGVLELFYVHNFGIITQDSYFGKSNNDIVIPIFILIYIACILIVLIKKYRKSINDNIYQYKNIVYLGIIIFLLSFFINAFIQIFNYQGLISSIKNIIYSFQFFSILVFPIAVIISVFVIISSIKLLKKEGFTWKNMLGIMLGVLIIFGTIVPEILNNYLQAVTFIDVHNEKGIALYIHQFVETYIFACLTYLECILLGTIVLGIKSSKHIPNYDKDYIIILGCMIKKDGTITPLLKSRVDRALEFARVQKEKTNKDIIIVPSGGKGEDEVISEAEAMKNYLIEQGINNENIIMENKSKNTFENIKFSYNIIKEKKKNPRIAFSTTNYHVFRAGNIAFNQNIKLDGIGSKTKSYFWINAFIREFIATIYSERKKHLIILLVIMVISILAIILLYVSNIL